MSVLDEKAKKRIVEMRKERVGYKRIANELGLNRDQVRGFCRTKAALEMGLDPDIKGESPEHHVLLKKYTCKHCGERFTKKESETGSLVYCSQSCKYKERLERKKQRDRMKVPKVHKLTCYYCKKEFETTHKKKYCSDRCRERTSIERSKKRTRVCVGCNKEYAVYSSHGKKYCSRSCYTFHTRKTHQQYCRELLETHQGYIVPIEEYKGAEHTLKCMCLKCGSTVERKARLYVGFHSRGCTYCGVYSQGEDRIRMWLDIKGIEYEREFTFDELKHESKLRYDFAIKHNGEVVMLIEYDGEQHFKAVEAFGGEDKLRITQERDAIKTDFAREKGMKLLRINFKQKKKVNEILSRELSSAIPPSK